MGFRRNLRNFRPGVEKSVEGVSLRLVIFGRDGGDFDHPATVLNGAVGDSQGEEDAAHVGHFQKVLCGKDRMILRKFPRKLGIFGMC